MQESAFTQQLEASLSQVRIQIAQTRKALKEAQIDHRPAPPQPTTCCGRGCNGCVWEGWYAAVNYWQEQADQLIANHKP
ncbi:oxidoreductase-like domain-containing protein [Variovorax sp. PCZ-1]|uniref:oxidoreductase-like domain-containing protein n=1 Tax=Variovorax sp. PCZ-1 TaxID=2835533 RepID=UPI001BCC9CF6|nr:oxidoreductase-like domain-containing protein [Variovorax sp. PCZ-1]MBS7808977.1 oxidoreductase [Variovorax sp. PCZ-1]